MGIEIFSDPQEFIGLFQSEPLVADVGMPWNNNHLIFRLNNGTNDLFCEIVSSRRMFKFISYYNEIEAINLDLDQVEEVTVLRNSERGTLRIVVTYNNVKLLFWIHLIPMVSLHVKTIAAL